MKKIITISLICFIVIFMASCSSNNETINDNNNSSTKEEFTSSENKQQISDENNEKVGSIMTKKVVAAYLSDWALKEFRSDDKDKLTHINYSFGKIKDGKVTDEHWINKNVIKELIKENENITFILSIGGWGAGGFSEAASSEEGRKLFASTAIELMNQYHFKGIDIDWESPGRSDSGIVSSKDDKKNFTLMLKELRKQLDEQEKNTKEKYLLTIAVGAAEQYAKDIELKEIDCLLDYIFLMTYDMASYQQVTHHTNLYPSKKYQYGGSISSAVQAYLKHGATKSKLVIGAAFYGHKYQINDIEAENVIGAMKNIKRLDPINYTDINANINNGYEKYFDETAKAPYLYDGKTVIVYDDEESVKEKAKYSIDENLGGIMFWEYNGDQTGKLLNAIYEAMKEHF